MYYSTVTLMSSPNYYTCTYYQLLLKIFKTNTFYTHEYTKQIQWTIVLCYPLTLANPGEQIRRVNSKFYQLYLFSLAVKKDILIVSPVVRSLQMALLTLCMFYKYMSNLGPHCSNKL